MANVSTTNLSKPDNTLNMALADAQRRDAQHSRLTRDWVALITIFLIVVTYHIQNPLLQFEVDFGKAFRNPTLQPVLAIGLSIGTAILVGNWRKLRRERVRMIASVGLGLYVIYILLAVVLRINLLGAALGLPQEAFREQLREESEALIPLFQNALTISTIFEYAAVVCVVVLWEPWKRISLYVKAVRRNAAALSVAVITLILWETLINVLQIQEFLLPKPSTIGGAFFDIYSKGLISVGWNTFQNAFWGFVVGCGLGVLIGLVSARFTGFSAALLPMAIAANSVPIIAFAPIVNFWFGALNPASKVAIVAILTFFPAMISAVKGLTSVNNTSLELMRSYAASDWEIFRKLRFPTALPYIFSSLKVATTLSMIGAIVSEYFGGTTQGLGYRIREDAANFKYPEAWAAIIIASLLGILFYTLVSAVERTVMPWHVSFRDE
jgi:NitT/TauT family transport system permease protein